MPASHTVEKIGEGKVRICDLELFMGFDPSIDGDDDKHMRDYDNPRVREIVRRTSKFISRGSRPKLVVEHERDGRQSKPEAVGDVTEVRYEERNGVGYVVGDIEMPQDAFDSLLATNAFPRRSAEIWKDGHLSEVALLGRDTPRRPLPDTRFIRVGAKSKFEQQSGAVVISIDTVTKFGESGVGGGLNTFIPTHGATKKKEQGMAKKKKSVMETEDDKALATLVEAPKMVDDDEKNFDESDIADDLAGEDVSQETEKSVGDSGVEKAKEGDEDDDEDDDEDKNKSSRNKDEKVTMAQQNEIETKALFSRVQELERQLKHERLSKDVDAMLNDGYRCVKFRAAMVDELVSSPTPEGKIAFWRATMARNPINVPPLAPLATQGYSEKLSPREATARAVSEAGGDIAKFKLLFAKYSGDTA